jgi:hypothetical protein
MVSKIDNVNVPDLGTKYSAEEAEYMVKTYINSILSSKQEQPQSGDLLDFFPLVQYAIDARQRIEDVKEEHRLLVLEDDPPEAIDTPSITWSLKARVPGRLNQGSAGSGSRKEVIPHQRSIVDHPDNPGEKLITMGKFYGTWIDFNIYTRGSKEALERVLWFERLMDSFSWYFRLHGFRAVEEGVGDKEKVIIKDLELVKYPITYFIRSDDTFHITTQELKRVLITTNISK